MPTYLDASESSDSTASFEDLPEIAPEVPAEVKTLLAKILAYFHCLCLDAWNCNFALDHPEGTYGWGKFHNQGTRMACLDYHNQAYLAYHMKANLDWKEED